MSWPTYVSEPTCPQPEPAFVAPQPILVQPLVVEGFWCWRCSSPEVKVWHSSYCPAAPVDVICPACGHVHECSR